MTIQDKNKLIELKGVQLPKFQFSLKKMGNFLYHEGPILSHLINENNEDFLMKWCDKDEICNRWMIFRTPSKILHEYFHQKINMREMILKNPDSFVYFVDIDNKINWQPIFLVSVDQIPEDYLPYETSFFNTTSFDSYTLQLKSKIDNDFSNSEKKYQLPSEQNQIAMAMEPEVPYYKKKKKNK